MIIREGIRSENTCIPVDIRKHCYDSETMETQEYKMGEHDGVLLIYELPDTVKEKKTEAEAYAAVWDIMMELQKELPNSVVYYGHGFLAGKKEKEFDEMGVFLPLEHFSDRLERHIEKRIKLYMVNKKMHLVEKDQMHLLFKILFYVQ